MPYTSQQWREIGHSRGYNAANYAVNVSGENTDELTPDMPLGLSGDDGMWFRDGFDRGIEQYINEQCEESFPS